MSAALPLAWSRQPCAAGELFRSAFIHEPDSNTRAQILTNNTVHLMSPLVGELLKLALDGDDVLVNQTADFLSLAKEQ